MSRASILTRNRISYGITLITGAWRYILLGLAAIGLYAVRKHARQLAWNYAILVLSTLTSSITLAIPRYRLPVMLFVCVVSALGIYYAAVNVFGRPKECSLWYGT